ncbi:mechanosensitive ion channel protein 6 [Selaginella moellendorffii]|nr:mechanosensitive ion channel protein 6 [Selaginella moellendorffii]|eukprot:XP_002983152.2 mechanosensitive ion channel protein 6 [Selaginella moellendorffii]
MGAVAKEMMMNGEANAGSKLDRVILRIDEDAPSPTGQPSLARNSTHIAEDERKEGSLERSNSYFFQDDPATLSAAQSIDPPTKLIGEFLRHQKESGDFQLDPGVGVDGELTFWESPSTKASLRRRSSSTSDRYPDAAEAGALDPSSAKAASRIPSYGRCKSRLGDPPPPPLRSGLLKSSGVLNKSPDAQAAGSATGAAEDDPLDVPDDLIHKPWNLWVFLEWGFLALSIGALVCTTNIPVLERRKLLGLHLWRWAVLALVILSGRLLSGWIIRFLVFFIERNFILRKRLVYFVYGLHKGVQNCLWFGIILLAWRLLFDPNLPLPIRRERKALEIVTRILICLLVAASLWLVKILLVKVLALSFHVNTFFDRIQESLFNEYILESLSGPPLLESQGNPSQVLKRSGEAGKRSSEADPRLLKKSGNIGGGGGGDHKSGGPISIEHLQRMNQKNVSAWNMKRLIRLAKSPRITTLAHAIDSDEDSCGGGSGGLEGDWQAKAAAKHIFNNAARPGCRCLSLVDLMRFLGDEECAIKAFALFDGAMETGKISKQALVNFVVNVYREKRALSFSLNDTKTAVKKLHRITDVIMGIIILVIWLLILGIATTHLLVALSSQLVLAVFVFGNTCKTVFEAIIFLFAMHPFDVGDRCVVDGVQMVVEEMNILTTVFLRYDNEKIYYPNSVLATKPISNFYRSPDMGDAIDFSLHISTPAEKIDALKVRIKRYIDSHLHHWHPKHDVVMREIEDMNRVRMSLWLQHTMNHQNAGEKWIRRSDLLIHLKDSFQELEIDYRLLPQEVRLSQSL